MLKKVLQLISSTLALSAFLLGSLHWMRVLSPRQVILRTFKSVSEALAPFLAIGGVLGGLLSFHQGARLMSLAGLTGSVLSSLYIWRVTHPQRSAAQRKITPIIHNTYLIHLPRMLERRWYWRLPLSNEWPRWEKDIAFGTVPETGATLLCDLWKPADGIKPTGLAFLYVHGGGFFTSHKDFGTRSLFRHLADQGHLVMDIDYRLAPAANLYDMQSDVRRAIAWLKANADRCGVQPDQIVLAGGSAGALLALLVSYTPDHPVLTPADLQGVDVSVQAAVSYYGVVDLAALYRKLQGTSKQLPQNPRFSMTQLLNLRAARRMIGAAAWLKGAEPDAMYRYVLENGELLAMGVETAMKHLIGGSPEEVPDHYLLLSPLTYAGAGCPPTLLFHGEHDYLLPVSATRALYHRLADAGVPALYVELPQTEHTFDLFLPEISPPAQSALYDLDRFLARMISMRRFNQPAS